MQTAAQIAATMTLPQLTAAMLRLEDAITREQSYIAKHGNANDANPDDQWIQYKASAAQHIQDWDTFSARRAVLKGEAAKEKQRASSGWNGKMPQAYNSRAGYHEDDMYADA